MSQERDVACRLVPVDSPVDISIVIPAYNEAARVGETLRSLARYRARSPHQLEIIAVDDGSTDATSDVLEAARADIPDLIVARHTTNSGKGRAVATGMELATSRFRAFFDADEATPFDAIDDLVDAALARPDSVAIGSVRAPGSVVVRSQTLLRSLAGRAGNLLIQAAVLPGIRDTQRGCKLFPAEAADLAFGSLTTDGWAFDIEVLASCRLAGHGIVEVPIRWTHIDGGQLRASAYSETLTEVRRIRALMRERAAAEAETPLPELLPDR